MDDRKKLLARIGTARDAISKKGGHTVLDYMVDGVLMECADMLQDQEPVMPNRTVNEHGFRYDFCGACGTLLPVYPDCNKVKFCQMCGKAVNWDE